MKPLCWLWLAGVLLLFAGCASPLPLAPRAEPLADAALREQLIQHVRAWAPPAFVMRQRAILQRDGRDVPFELFVACDRLQSLRLQARGDFGGKWFDLEAHAGRTRVLSNDTPFPDAMLLGGLLADQQLLWRLPDFASASVWREPDDSLALRCPHGENTWEYRFNRDQLTELRSLRDGRIVRAIAITSQDGSPATLTVTNHAMRYTAHLDVIRVTAKPGGLR